MLRVGLTGGLGSGKSTAAKLFAAHGARVLYADEIGRQLMEPGQVVHAAIRARFGEGVLLADGRLDRPALARLAFQEDRAEELNAIVHPAVVARQAELMDEIGRRHPDAVAMVESALIFEAAQGREAVQGGLLDWQMRFDRMILVTAPEEVKVARFISRCIDGETTAMQRAELEAEARRRLARQISDEQKRKLCDYVLRNEGDEASLQWQVDQLWPILRIAAR
ncbi:MAG TPA: dephospho-CoA kinase [Edaphobacter sp.]|nr:dephospho-CoA kinase [Edaphobacter sp.]